MEESGVVIAVLAAGCATPAANQPAVNGQATSDRPGTRPLADTVTRRSQADIDQLQRLLDQRGLSPHGHSHQRVDNTSPTDLERLAALRGRTLDLAFVQVMTARSRAGSELATMTTGKRAWSKAHPSHPTARASGHSSGDGRR
jgi:hypothetical protein